MTKERITDCYFKPWCYVDEAGVLHENDNMFVVWFEIYSNCNPNKEETKTVMYSKKDLEWFTFIPNDFIGLTEEEAHEMIYYAYDDYFYLKR